MHRIIKSFAVGMFFIMPLLSESAMAAVESASWGQLKAQVVDHQPQPAGKIVTSNRVAGSCERCGFVVLNHKFKDRALLAVVLEALGKGPNERLYAHEAATISELFMNNKGITSLEGLQYLTSLRYFEADGNQIQDLSPLAGMRSLRGISVGSNHITDISVVVDLPDLYGLDVRDNQVTDISVLAGRNQFYWLRFAGNGLEDISALSGLTKLEQLWLRGNAIRDLTPIRNLTRLEVLNVGGNPLSDESRILYQWFVDRGTDES